MADGSLGYFFSGTETAQSVIPLQDFQKTARDLLGRVFATLAEEFPTTIFQLCCPDLATYAKGDRRYGISRFVADVFAADVSKPTVLMPVAIISASADSPRQEVWMGLFKPLARTTNEGAVAIIRGEARLFEFSEHFEGQLLLAMREMLQRVFPSPPSAELLPFPEPLPGQRQQHPHPEGQRPEGRPAVRDEGQRHALGRH